MNKLRKKFELFCYKHKDKGIPNLMLYITIGNAIVVLLSMFNGGNLLYDLLCFDKTRILKGEVWRLVTYAFTQSGTSVLELLFLYFFYMLGRHVEQSMGTFRFNLFYFSGIILMDVFAMIFCTDFTLPLYQNMAYYLHLSLILTFATAYPDAHFTLFFLIPIKAWILAAIYLVLTLADVFNLSFPVLYFPHNLFPLVALGNYLLFTGKNIINVLPPSWRFKHQRSARPKTGTIPFERKTTGGSPKQSVFYTHRCTVCGRTDQSNPELEFRYCSRCNGYHCYCQDHISNHSHIE